MSLIDELPLSPETRAKAAALPAPCRAWALAKAAFETAQEQNFAEQRAAVAEATKDDPEPPDWHNMPTSATRAQISEMLDAWKAWSDRNQQRIDIATAPIVARYPKELKDLMDAAEQNMVDFAEAEISRMFPDRFAAVKPAFEAYRENLLYGDMLKNFLNICFNCPSKL